MEDRQKVKDFLREYYKPGNYIFNQVIERNIGATEEDIEIIMMDLIDDGVVKEQYNVYCPHCVREIIHTVDSPEELGKEYKCNKCGTLFRVPYPTEKVYKYVDDIK